MYQAEEDPAEKQRIGEALEAQGYFSAAVPLSWEYQDYMRTYCHLYGCPGGPPQCRGRGGSPWPSLGRSSGFPVTAFLRLSVCGRYTDAVLEALERWECTVNAWAGE